jgi:predicted nucleic acid-binding protein
MSPALVLDCSLALSWCFPEEETPATERVRLRLESEAAAVPAHWFLEVTNVLALAERRRRIGAATSSAFLALLEEIDLRVDHESPKRAFSHLLPLCRSRRLTSYDAAYLDLALRTGLPLATLDADLRAGARGLGVPVIGS